MTNTLSLYEQLRALGTECDNHESDLYVKATLEVVAVVEASGRTFSAFLSNIDGALWLDVPFAFLPWWTQRQRT